MAINDSLERQIEKDNRADKWTERFTSGKWWGMVALCIVFPPMLLFVFLRGAFRWIDKVSYSKTELKAQKMERENERNPETYTEEQIYRERNPNYKAKQEFKEAFKSKEDKNYSWLWWFVGVGIFIGGLLIFPPIAILGFIVAAYQSMKMTVDMFTPNTK